MSASVLDNILFGNEYNKDRLNEVIQACCLEDDIEKLDQGLDTLLGERGINISGGQKARISLARACYSKADICLLDDPLSALDQNVAQAIYQSCIRGYLKNKCVILVTHQTQFIEEDQKVLTIDLQRTLTMSTMKKHSDKASIKFEKINSMKRFENKEKNWESDFTTSCTKSVGSPTIVKSVEIPEAEKILEKQATIGIKDYIKLMSFGYGSASFIGCIFLA